MTTPETLTLVAYFFVLSILGDDRSGVNVAEAQQ